MREVANTTRHQHDSHPGISASWLEPAGPSSWQDRDDRAVIVDIDRSDDVTLTLTLIQTCPYSSYINLIKSIYIYSGGLEL